MTKRRGERRSAGGARAHAGDVLEWYTDGMGNVRRSPRDSVRALREAVAGPEHDAGAGVRVIDAGSKQIRLGSGPAPRSHAAATLQLEDGGEIPLRIRRDSSGWRATAASAIPLGVHRVRGAGREVFVLSRPRTLAPIVARAGRRLALFLPLYAATPGGAFGLGSYSDLQRLCEWARGFDDALVGTLPLFPAFLDRPFDPSPYAPVTRLMWSELFIDPARAPEWRALRRAPRQSRESPPAYVDYRRCWSAARRTLRAMAGIARHSDRRWAEVLESCSAEVVRYARFRAAVDASGTTWDRWPASWRRLENAPLRTPDVNTYIYAQSIAALQMQSLSRSRGGKSPLYLDLPVGVHGGGFDTFCRPDLFLRGFSAGAPPDELNTHGQVWGFPPMHPTAGRADGYLHLRLVLRRLLSAAGVLRLDHVMGLYRMYCVRNGDDGSAGAYVRYPEDELFAVIMIEAARVGAVVVGEDLGTVPPDVRRIMRRRGLLGMHVQQFMFGSGDGPLQLPGAGALACLNTHDTPTFAGFWRGDDVALRRSLGHLSESDAAEERRARFGMRRKVSSQIRRRGLGAASAAQSAHSLTRLQCRTRSPLVAVNVEDLWSERRPQNVPGTSTEHRNWRRRSARPMRRVVGDASIEARLNELCRERRRAR